MCVVIAVLLIPVLLYVPIVQDFAKNIALKEVSKATGWDMELDYFRLKWPLRLDIEGLRVIEAPGDTMINARKAQLEVGLLPLLKLDVQADGHFEDVRYQLGTIDSAMYLVAKVKDFRLQPSSYNLRTGDVNVSKAVLDGGDVILLFNGNDTTATPVDTAASTSMMIKADELELKNVTYRMSMLPVIDSLGATVPYARLRKGMVDMATKRIHAQELTVDSVTASYFTPSAEYLKEHPVDTTAVAATDSVATGDMWVITGDKVSLTARDAIYAMRDAVPQPGFDVNYIQGKDITIKVDSFYNCGVNIRVPLKEFRGTERCGLKLLASGVYEMDSVAMRADNFNFSTIFSEIRLDGLMGMGDLMSDPSLPLKLKAEATVGISDIEMFLPSMKPMLAAIPRHNDIELEADIEGTVGNLDLNLISAELPHYLSMKVSGEVSDVTDPDHIGGQVSLVGNFQNVNFIKPTVLDAKLAPQVNIPPTLLTGDVRMNNGAFVGNLKAVAGGGDILLDAMWNGRVESYDVDLALDRFPVSAFMPGLGVGRITADVKAHGRGLDIMSPRTKLDAKMNIDSMQYLKDTYGNLRAWASLDTGVIDAGVISLNRNAHFDMSVTGTIRNGGYDMAYSGDVENLNLKALDFSTTACEGSFSLDGKGFFNPAKGIYDADIEITDLDWNLDGNNIATDTIKATLLANDSLTRATIDNNTLHGILLADCSLDSFTTKLSSAMTLLDRQIAGKRIYVDSLQRALPHFALDVNAGRGSVIDDFLAPSKSSFREAVFNVNNDSLITFNGKALGLKFGDTRIDTISFGALQHGKFLVYNARMNNKPGTFDEFAHVTATGYLANENLALFFNQRNIKNETGFKLGVNLASTDSVITMRLAPLNPVIGYKKWTLNADNTLSYNFSDHHIDANLDMASGQSHLKLFTDHQPGQPHHQEEIVIDVSGIQLADWLALSPFAPPVKGMLGADIRVNWNSEEKSIYGNGNVSLDDFYYDRTRVGSFLLGLDLNTNSTGVVHASTWLSVDSAKVLTANGTLNDSTAVTPFRLDLALDKFPLRVANPFLPSDMARLEGFLNGGMDVTGRVSEPRLDGYIAFDSASVSVGMSGTRLSFPTDPIAVDSSIVRFNNYAITALNENPLTINGTVDMNSFVSPKFNLSLDGNNVQIVNSSRGKGREIYGKAFIDLSANVKGNMDFMSVKASLNLLEGSNVTYVMATVDNSISGMNSDDDMVRFVQFSDTASIAEADTVTTTQLAMLLDANVIISQGSTINVDLSASGQDKASIQGNGNLTFTMSPFSDMRLTGRFNIDKGFVRYTPPLMSQKLFEFVNNSYIAFNGDMMNPILNIHAEDKLKANVTEEGQNSRLINFIVALNVTNTLENMNVAFDLSTNDDLTIQNELQTMSPEQRANQAMNLLLYNVYTGPGTKASSNLSGNPLFSFLTSQLNTWAANTIKGVDISFGIDQYDRTYQGASSTATSYSYKVSKTLFNDRVKIVVGGNYTDDSEHDQNLAESLINDVSFEYMLNRSGSMYVRLFRHVGYESILEGEVIQTGVGFVYKRKLSSLRDLFRFGHSKPRAAIKPESDEQVKNESDDTKQQ